MTHFHIKYFINDSSPSDRLSQILFGLLLFLSSLNLLRIRKSSSNDLRQSVVRAFAVFHGSTGVDILHGSSLEITSDDNFSETVCNFVSLIPLFPTQISVLLLPMLVTLRGTPHEVTGCVSIAALLGLFWSSGTPAAVRFSQDFLTEFLAFPNRIVISATGFASFVFNFESLQKWAPDKLKQLLAVVIGALPKAPKVEIVKILELLLNIARAASSEIVSQNGKAVLESLNRIIGVTCELTDVALLNVVGEFAKRAQNPLWFISTAPISFQYLLPLVVSADRKVQQRAFGIFAVLIFGSVKGVDLRLLFASLMPIFCAVEAGHAGYATMAGNLLTAVRRAEKVGKETVVLIGCVIEPLLAVGGGAQTVVASLKFLAKIAREDETEVGIAALALMTRLAAPRQGFVAKQSD